MNKSMNEHILSGKHSIWLAWVLLAVGLIGTAVIAIYVRNDVEADAKREFYFACDEIRLKIEARLNAHAQVLRSGAAFFDASDDVKRNEWQTFTMRQGVEQQLPGIQGIGFSLLIPREQLAQHIQEIRSQGFPEYRVRPEGQREIYSSIIYLEPFSGRNLRAFGYDMLSEPVRRAAMERARDTNSPALSGKVILVQETDKDVQAGTLMYVPVYRKGMPTDTVESRRAALYGWVYSPYRMNDLMKGILGGWDLQNKNRIRLQVFDGEHLSSDSLLYDSQPGAELISASVFNMNTKISSAGREWTLQFIRTGGEGASANFIEVWLVISCGAIISMLLFLLTLSLFNTRFRARQIADQLTANLRESEEKFRLMFYQHQAIMLLIEPESGHIIDANLSSEKFYGYTIEQLCRMSTKDINLLSSELTAEKRKLAINGKQNYFIFQHRLARGEIRTVEVYSSPMVVNEKKLLFSIIHDITERKLAEDTLKLNEARFESLFRISQYKTDNVKTLMDYALSEAIQLTHSKIGYIYYYNESSQQFTLNTWSKDVMKECRITKPLTLGSRSF